MTQFVLEDDIDFKKELQKLKHVKKPEEQQEYKMCFITKEPLQKFHITLQCKHTFNYMPIYQETLFQRNLSSTKGYMNNVPPIGTIRCPYCREINSGVLPYFDLNDVKMIKYVNAPLGMRMKCYPCSWKTLTGKNKGKECPLAGNVYEKGCYCEMHYSRMIKMEETRKAKEELKEQQKLVTKTCQYIMERGKRKGEKCDKVVCKDSEDYCKCHFKSIEKKKEKQNL